MPTLSCARRRTALFLLAAACLLGSTAARAETWPSRPITLVVSFEPGGSTDISARAVAQALSVELKQAVVVENRAGAGGRIGTKAAALARPDGYTLLWGSGSSLTAAPAIYPNQEHVATLVPVSLGATQSFVFVTNPGLGVRTVQEFVALAKRQPGKLNFASAGMGSSNHLLGEIFLAATGAPVVHVPYKGAVMAKDAVIRGEAQLMDEVSSPLIGALRAGQLVPLFMTGERRDPAFPAIPTAAEAGLPEMTIQGFFGLLAPAGTPPEIVARLNEAMRAALASEAVAKAFGNLGFTTVYSTPGQMAARIAEGRATYDRIVRTRQIRVD
ncbi:MULTISPECIES: Bug family tripartite tricarboxylate transporter substrate binding protein [unclassified Variovorax]|jgi:tripartite-type tricarboxylate transporter receptor subunit TctC|uniref:Bug family tripartite tricarboxylate transporter substrate binding protein n=1 Tax=unclassified Variovorax TaxID=663243 RepID=UPI000D1290DC|nr:MULTISPECIES: tripartite tricarboxylate transporter substrate binding protein [unclassified Variovorax]AVQ85111.1 tripartite tricarboxylate transporter substrate binding protein [Variovorax sp. PMC12]QRY34733.1 tripartite tricarboxylate transporter substrate binding protein [Variovorax sp. PDNC026]